jgi:hypothetical protein
MRLSGHVAYIERLRLRRVRQVRMRRAKTGNDGFLGFSLRRQRLALMSWQKIFGPKIYRPFRVASGVTAPKV